MDSGEAQDIIVSLSGVRGINLQGYGLLKEERDLESHLDFERP